eukprot:scaffold155032_cov47-Attheya_sp.AAC.1
MFEYAEQLRTIGIAASPHGPALKPFDVSLPQDMASFWKAFGLDGAAKVKEFFCHLCSCRSSDILQSFLDRIDVKNVILLIVNSADTTPFVILPY